MKQVVLGIIGCTFAAGTVVAGLDAGSALALTIISTLPGNDGTETASVGGLRTKSLGFTLPGGQNYSLDDIILRLDVQNIAVDGIALQLFGDVGGAPGGTALLDFLTPTFTSTGIADYSFLPNSPFTLQASTTYWIAARGPSGSTIDWNASIPSATPTGIASTAGAYFSSDGTYPALGPSSILNSYQVDGTPVGTPVPGPLPVFGAAAALGYSRKLRKRLRDSKLPVASAIE
jgi:hypothetical protein